MCDFHHNQDMKQIWFYLNDEHFHFVFLTHS